MNAKNGERKMYICLDMRCQAQTFYFRMNHDEICNHKLLWYVEETTMFVNTISCFVHFLTGDSDISRVVDVRELFLREITFLNNVLA